MISALEVLLVHTALYKLSFIIIIIIIIIIIKIIIQFIRVTSSYSR